MFPFLRYHFALDNVPLKSLSSLEYFLPLKPERPSCPKEGSPLSFDRLETWRSWKRCHERLRQYRHGHGKARKMWSREMDTTAREQAWRLTELSGLCFEMDGQRLWKSYLRMIWQNITVQHKVFQIGDKVTLTSKRDYLPLPSDTEKTNKWKWSCSGKLSGYSQRRGWIY